MGGRFRREGTYVYLWLIHVDVWRKPTQYCKAFILQLKINKLNYKKKKKWPLLPLSCSAKHSLPSPVQAQGWCVLSQQQGLDQGQLNKLIEFAISRWVSGESSQAAFSWPSTQGFPIHSYYWDFSVQSTRSQSDHQSPEIILRKHPIASRQ